MGALGRSLRQWQNELEGEGADPIVMAPVFIVAVLVSRIQALQYC